MSMRTLKGGGGGISTIKTSHQLKDMLAGYQKLVDLRNQLSRTR
jgi:hypothetical protein